MTRCLPGNIGFCSFNERPHRQDAADPGFKRNPQLFGGRLVVDFERPGRNSYLLAKSAPGLRRLVLKHARELLSK